MKTLLALNSFTMVIETNERKKNKQNRTVYANIYIATQLEMEASRIERLLIYTS